MLDMTTSTCCVEMSCLYLSTFIFKNIVSIINNNNILCVAEFGLAPRLGRGDVGSNPATETFR